MSPVQHVLNSLPVGLELHPQLQVLQAVVLLVAVLVMNVLAWKQLPPEVLLHDESVLKNPETFTDRAITSHPDVSSPGYVPTFHLAAPTLDSRAAAPWTGERVPVAPKSVSVPVAVARPAFLQFASLDAAGRPIGPMQPPVLVAALAQLARLVVNRPAASGL